MHTIKTRQMTILTFFTYDNYFELLLHETILPDVMFVMYNSIVNIV